MLSAETNPGKIFQSTLEGERVECQLGFDLTKTYQTLRQEFAPGNEGGNETRFLENGSGRISAFLFLGFNGRDQTERILAAGITQGGYLASPQLLFEKRTNGEPEAITIKWGKARWTIKGGDEPWRPAIKSGKLVNPDPLRCLELLAGGEGLPYLYDQLKFKKANFRRRMKLLKRWGITMPLKTQPALFAALK